MQKIESSIGNLPLTINVETLSEKLSLAKPLATKYIKKRLSQGQSRFTDEELKSAASCSFYLYKGKRTKLWPLQLKAKLQNHSVTLMRLLAENRILNLEQQLI